MNICKECDYYINGHVPKCSMNKRVNLVTGEVEEQYCTTVRMMTGDDCPTYKEQNQCAQ